MIKSTFQKLLVFYGKRYKLDKKIPNKFLLRVMYSRLFMLFRGRIFYGKRVFLGRKVSLINKKNISLGSNVTIEKRAIIDGFCEKKITIGENSKIGEYCEFSCTSHFSKYGKGFSLGKNSGVGKFGFFGASGGITIGDDVIMGEYVSFHSENHIFSDTSKLIRKQGVTSKGIVLGNNIWVGAKATFLDGTVVGNNSVVAAGAVVKGKFPENVVIGGVPAKIIKYIESTP